MISLNRNLQKNPILVIYLTRILKTIPVNRVIKRSNEEIF